MRWLIGVGVALTFLGFALIPLPGPGAFFICVGLILVLIGIALSESETSDRSEMSPGARGSWAYFGVGGVFWVALPVAILIGYLTAPDHNASGTCVGLGFGCVPSPKDGMFFVVLFGMPVCVAAGGLAIAVVAGTRALRRRSR